MPDRAVAMPLRPGDRAAIVGDGRGFLLPILRPGRHGPRPPLAIDPDLVHLLVEEREEAPDLRAFRDRLGIAPDDVRIFLPADPRRPVASPSLVRAGGRLLAR